MEVAMPRRSRNPESPRSRYSLIADRFLRVVIAGIAVLGAALMAAALS
jgi:hypothetical protein